jgi:hypothetical protein
MSTLLLLCTAVCSRNITFIAAYIWCLCPFLCLQVMWWRGMQMPTSECVQPWP